MFGVPVRSNDASGTTIFKVEVNVTPLGIELEYDGAQGLYYNKDAQSRFRTLQNLTLSELAKEKDLFKNPPTLASLEAITPNWGFVLSGNKQIFSPYAVIDASNIARDKLPCLVDVQLKALEISRSTLKPVFKLHYLGPKKAEIDFEWPVAVPLGAGDEIVEVSELPAAADGTVITLTDPAQQRKQRQAEKAEIRAALLAAEQARAAAEARAAEFYEKYDDDLSDNESAFTGYLSDASQESDSE
jgi:hypothetical protein